MGSPWSRAGKGTSDWYMVGKQGGSGTPEKGGNREVGGRQIKRKGETDRQTQSGKCY